MRHLRDFRVEGTGIRVLDDDDRKIRYSKGFERNMCSLGVEQFKEDADRSDEERDEYHGEDGDTEDSEGSEETDSE
ncbi:hypothetical protein DL764_005488 [Monosporascus ibericus]|uniref:Uncharacterized protein n=1 Tax=Monosporascus ibericus TaxID=155417 RepID=A0A4Q4TAU8_9PEZI|nr:hypothetical protein DL764_005488 [Monosporascus ibericus]